MTRDDRRPGRLQQTAAKAALRAGEFSRLERQLTAADQPADDFDAGVAGHEWPIDAGFDVLGVRRPLSTGLLRADGRRQKRRGNLLRLPGEQQVGEPGADVELRIAPAAVLRVHHANAAARHE